MRTLANPDPWPPDLSYREPLELLSAATTTLLGELRTRGPKAPSYTWWPPDQTVGFWYRRMAQETAVHRVDVEQAHDRVTPIDPELAADGVDEALLLMLAGDWSDYPVDEAAGSITLLSTAGRNWRVELDRTTVSCTELAPGADPGLRHATVEGEPHDLVLWVWGRQPLDLKRLTVEGDQQVIEATRRRLALATQ
jgi:uncharacterized protein (TIGR03083 family)